MTNYFVVCIVTALLALSNACSKSSNSSDSPIPADPGRESNETYELNGESAETYYNKFLYSESGEGSLKYSFIKSSYQKIGERTTDSDKQICGSFSLFLLPNKDFTLDYFESYCIVDSRRPETQKKLFRKRLQGQWRVDKTSLVIGDLMTGVGYILNNKDVVGFTFKRSIHEVHLEKERFVGYYVHSNVGIED